MFVVKINLQFLIKAPPFTLPMFERDSYIIVIWELFCNFVFQTKNRVNALNLKYRMIIF